MKNEVRQEGPVAFLRLEDRQGNTVAEAMIDSADMGRVLDFGRWRRARNGYVYSFTRAEGRRRDVALHRFLLSAPEGKVVDHINHDPLDNRKANLRLLTKAENMQNRRGPVIGKRDPFRNVYRQTKSDGYVVRVQGRYFGTFPTLDEAARVAVEARRQVLPYSTA